MLKTARINKHRSRRPWWLLLTLVLFFAGQTLAAGHWHDDGLNHKGKSLDNACALCVYSSTATAAVNADSWQIPVFTFAIIWLTALVSFNSVAARFFDSRAPPSLLS